MKQYINRFKRFINGIDIDDKEIFKIIENNGFHIQDLYDLENIKGSISSFKLNKVTPTFLYEGIDFEIDEPGGVIIFSADLNSTLADAQTFKDKVKFFFDSKWKTFLNRLNVDDRVRKILLDKYKLPGYTFGKGFSGNYTGKNGITFNEKSFTIYIAGVDSNILVLIATEICREFKQETVLVRDFNSDGRPRVYLVNDKEVNP